MIFDEEKVIDRIRELSEAIENLPESKLVPIWQNEIEYLKTVTVW